MGGVRARALGAIIMRLGRRYDCDEMRGGVGAGGSGCRVRIYFAGQVKLPDYREKKLISW